MATSGGAPGVPGRLRRWLVRPLGWSLALLALGVGLFSWSLRSGWLAERSRVLVEARLGELLGRRVRCERLALSAVPLSLEAWGVTVAGPRPDDPALAEIAHLSLVADLEGLSRPRLTLHEVLLERPVFRLQLLADDSDNLPRLGRSGTGAGRLRLRLAGLEIRDGLFDFGDERVPLSVVARGIEADLVGSGDTLLGGVHVASAAVELPGAKSYAATVTAQVALAANGLEMHSVEVSGPDLVAHLDGDVRWGRGTRVRLDGRVETSDLLARDLGLLDAELAGQVKADAHFLWQPDRPWQVTGTFEVPTFDFWNLGIHQVTGRLALDGAHLLLDGVSAQALDGSVDGSVRFDFAARPITLGLDLQVAAASVERLLASREIVLGAPLDAVLTGKLRLSVPLGDGGETTGALDLEAIPAGRPDAVALSGPVRFDFGGGRLTSRELTLVGEVASVDARGSYELAAESGDFDFSVTTDRLAALVRLLPVAVDPANLPLWYPTGGAGRVTGRLELRPRAVASRFALELEHAVSRGLAAERVDGEMGVDANGLSGIRLTAHQGATSVTLGGDLPFAETQPLALHVALADWPAASLMPWLPMSLPLAGPVRGEVELTGTLAALAGRARLTVTPATAYGVDLDSLEAALRFDPAGVQVEHLAARLPAGQIAASGRYGLPEESLDFQFSAPGLDLAAAPFSALLPAPLSGVGELGGTLRGRFAAPDLALTWRTAGVQVGQASLPDASLSLRWSDGAARAEGSLFGLVEVTGGGPFGEGSSRLDLQLVARDLPRLALLAGLPEDLGVTGSLRGSLHVEGDPFGDAPLRARLSLPEVELDYADYRLSALQPVTLDIAGGRVDLRSLYLGERGSGGEIVLSGLVDLARERQLDLRLQASVPAALLGRYLPALTLSGEIDMLAAVRGTIDRPRFNGQAELSDGKILLADFPHTFDQVRASVLFYPDRAVLDTFTAELGGGRLRAGGTVVWERTDGGDGPDYRFQVAAEKVSLRYPAGWLLRGDADLTLQSLDEGRVLRGTVRLDRAYFLQDLPANVGQVLGRILERQRLSAGTTDDLLAGTSLALTLQAPQALRVRNNLADLRGSADLSLRGTLAQPALFGRVEAERGGKLVYSGTDYSVERARLTFSNPLRIEPVVDLEARAKVEEYEVTMSLSGTFDRLSASFTSDPPLPSLDVLGLLAVGQPVSSEGAAPLPVATGTTDGAGSLQAEALLYSQAASLISSRVEGLFGLDKLRIDPLTTSRDVVSSARITVGKRLSRRLYVTYTLDPSTTEQQQVQVEWQVSDQLLVVLTQNGSETYAADLRWEKRF